MCPLLELFFPKGIVNPPKKLRFEKNTIYTPAIMDKHLETLLSEIQSLKIENISGEKYVKKEDIVKLLQQRMTKNKKLTPNSTVFILHKQGDVFDETGACIDKSYFEIKYSEYEELKEKIEKYKTKLEDIEGENLYKLFKKAKVLGEPPEYVDNCDILLSIIKERIEGIVWENERKPKGLGCGELQSADEDMNCLTYVCGKPIPSGTTYYCPSCERVRLKLNNRRRAPIIEN